MLSEQDVQTYRRDGVIMVPDVLGTETLAQLRAVIAELVAGSAKTLDHTDVYDLEPGHTAESPRVLRIKTPHKVHGLFDRIVRLPEVLDILKQLVGPGRQHVVPPRPGTARIGHEHLGSPAQSAAL